MLGSGIFGIDIDGIEEDIQLYKNGSEDNVVAEFVHSLGSYAEYSQSGKGLHVICKGKLPSGGRRKGQYEFYESGRFFVMTGNSASDYKDVVDCTEGVKHLHRKYIGEPTSSVSNVQPTGQLNMNESDIVDLAIKSKQGQAFSTLYNGFWKGLYPSQSEADMAFCNMLAFWTQADKIKGENKGQMFYSKDEAEKRAGYLNDIPDGVTYTVAEIELK
jgi:putative DNA primase/helicase